MPIVPADCTAEPVENNLPRINHETSLLIIQSSFGLDSSSYEFIKAITLNQKRI